MLGFLSIYGTLLFGFVSVAFALAQSLPQPLRAEEVVLVLVQASLGEFATFRADLQLDDADPATRALLFGVFAAWTALSLLLLVHFLIAILSGSYVSLRTSQSRARHHLRTLRILRRLQESARHRTGQETGNIVRGSPASSVHFLRSNSSYAPQIAANITADVFLSTR